MCPHKRVADLLTTYTADIFSSGNNLEDVASQFLTQYADNNPAALAEMVNMIILSAGCTLQVTQDDVNDTENVENKISDLQDEYQAVSQILLLS